MTATPRHYWQTRPPANRLGDAPWRHGKLMPMDESKTRWWRHGGEAQLIGDDDGNDC